MRQYGDRIDFIGVATGDTLENAEDFISYYGLTGLFPATLSEHGELLAQMGVGGAPAWAFVHENGDSFIYLGGITLPKLSEFLDQVITA